MGGRFIGAAAEKLAESEKLIAELNQTWEEKLARTQEMQREREKMLEDIGVAVKTSDKGAIGATGNTCRMRPACRLTKREYCAPATLSQPPSSFPNPPSSFPNPPPSFPNPHPLFKKKPPGLLSPQNVPHLVNLNEDNLLNECLVYYLRPGRTLVGAATSEVRTVAGSAPTRAAYADVSLTRAMHRFHATHRRTTISSCRARACSSSTANLSSRTARSPWRRLRTGTSMSCVKTNAL